MFKRKKNSAELEQNETLKSLRRLIKGYEGYKDRAGRSTTDIVFRQYILDLLSSLYDQYSQVHNELMRAQILSAWQSSNVIMNSIQFLRKYLSDDVYRHSTFFEANDVTGILEISVFYILESEIVLTLEGVSELTRRIQENLVNIEMLNIEKDIMNVQKNIDEIKLAITDRAELIASFELVGV